MSLLRAEIEFEMLNTATGPWEYEEVTLFLGEVIFGTVSKLTGEHPTRKWQWKTGFPGMVETEDGADTYEDELGSHGFTVTKEEAVAALERKAERFLNYIGCVPATKTEG